MEAVKVSEATPEQVHAALNEGALREVVIFCDICELQTAVDTIGDPAEDRFEGARRYLRAHRGWAPIDSPDICPFCLAGVRMCTQEIHEFCEHPGWPVTEDGIAVLPEDWGKYYEARKVALGESDPFEDRPPT